MPTCPPPPGDTPAVVDSLDDLRARLGRLGFAPETEPGDHGPSQFGGRPWLASGETWPECRHCSKPMLLLLQLDLDALPDGAPPQRSGGLLQVFYCTSTAPHCESEARGWEPFATCHMQRVLVADEAGGQVEFDRAAQIAGDAALQPRTIKAWTPHQDLPTGEDLNELPAILGPSLRATIDASQPQDLSRPGHKLGGWPLGLEAPEYPACPECGEPMEHLFQIDSLDAECTLPVKFGGSGSGYVTRCRNHPRVIGFGWARR